MSWLATGDASQTIRLWDLEAGTCKSEEDQVGANVTRCVVQMAIVSIQVLVGGWVSGPFIHEDMHEDRHDGVEEYDARLTRQIISQTSQTVLLAVCAKPALQIFAFAADVLSPPNAI